MGYHVAVVRPDSEAPITLREWQHCSEKMASFDYLEESKTWTLRDKPGQCLWFSEEANEVWSSNPSDELIKVMLQISASLGAQVRGDEGEIIQWADFDVPQHLDESVQNAAKSFHQRKKAKQWLMLLAVAAGALLGYFNGR